MKGILSRVIQWNLYRNNLKFDAALEFNMLHEEAKEFYEATTFVDQVDAYCDFKFVSIGSLAKYAVLLPEDVGTYIERRDLLKEYIQGQLDNMLAVLEAEWATFGTYTSLESFLTKAFEAVVTANEAKGTQKDANGKVMKGEDYVPPEETIEEILKQSVSVGQGVYV